MVDRCIHLLPALGLILLLTLVPRQRALKLRRRQLLWRCSCAGRDLRRSLLFEETEMFEILTLSARMSPRARDNRLPYRPPPAGFTWASPTLHRLRLVRVVSANVTGASDEQVPLALRARALHLLCAVDRCPQTPERIESPPVLPLARELDAGHTVPFPPCQACGKPAALHPKP